MREKSLSKAKPVREKLDTRLNTLVDGMSDDGYYTVDEILDEWGDSESHFRRVAKKLGYSFAIYGDNGEIVPCIAKRETALKLSVR